MAKFIPHGSPGSTVCAFEECGEPAVGVLLSWDVTSPMAKGRFTMVRFASFTLE
jgi:hypothetical protein